LLLEKLWTFLTYERHRSRASGEQRFARRALIGDLRDVQLQAVLAPLVAVLTALRRCATQIRRRRSQISDLQRAR